MQWDRVYIPFAKLKQGSMPVGSMAGKAKSGLMQQLGIQSQMGQKREKGQGALSDTSGKGEQELLFLIYSSRGSHLLSFSNSRTSFPCSPSQSNLVQTSR